MGTRVTSGAARRRIIFFLIIVCVPLVTNHDEATAEAPPCPPVNSCPNALISPDAVGCTPSSGPPPPHDGGDLDRIADIIGDQELKSATLTDAVVLALITARKDDMTDLEAFFILIVSSVVFALVFSEIPLRNMCPRFAQMVEMLVVIIFVNGVMALRLPTKFLWVPAVCLALSLLTFIGAPCLP